MDKSWINILNRLDPLYENGAKEFLHFVSLDRPHASAILCPCRKCRNMKFVQINLIVEHIVVDGFLTSYTSWIFHGEQSSSSVSVNQLDKDDEMQDMLHEAIALCHLEILFPPSFFDIMEHLVIHLAEEEILAGPSQYRSMWSIERFLLCFKNYVRSRSNSEGSIVEGYWIEECMTFCTRYLDDVETKSSRPLRNSVFSNEVANQEGRRSSREKRFKIDGNTRTQAHRSVLFNSASTTSYRDEHIKEIKKKNPRLSRHDVDKIHNERFQMWFRNYVEKMHMAGQQISEDIQNLAVGPLRQAKRMTGYISNGVRYLTESRDIKRKTQNSGIMVKATTQSYANSRDKNPILAEVSFYGILTDIIELYYTKKLKFVLFRCEWVNNNKGLIEKDDYDFTLVNFNHLLYPRNQLSDEPSSLLLKLNKCFMLIIL